MRAKRTERRGRTVVLRRRDEVLLRALVRFRAVDSAALMQVVFPTSSRQAAARRLRALHDAGYITAHVRNLAAPNVYTLGPRGRAWAVAHGLKPGRAPRGLAQHHLDTVRTWVALARAAKDLDWRLTFIPEWEARGVVSHGAVPDGLAELAFGCPQGPGHVLQLVVEVDRTTESLATMRSKVESLSLLATSGELAEDWDIPILALVLFGASDRRCAALRKLAEEAWLGPAVVWGADDLLHPLLTGLAESVATGWCNGSNSVSRVTHDSATR